MSVFVTFEKFEGVKAIIDVVSMGIRGWKNQ
jgi:hypothetical protein